MGDVDNYVEPFAGSLAVLLRRPHEPRIETVNDLSCMVSNFWRAVAAVPYEVAHHADWPVNEVDLEARHYWLVRQQEGLRDRMGDPDYYDPKIAGWWVWGMSAWIGGGWCSGTGPWTHDGQKWANDGDAGQGINRQRQHLGGGGSGINRSTQSDIYGYFAALAARLRRVRVCCGDWSRICGPAVTWRNGLTGVFLDPPYAMEGRSSVYEHETDVYRDVTAWALENGSHRDMRIVVAGYAGEHTALESAGWRVHAWKAQGGFGNLGNGRGRENAHRERLWFSPHCISPMQERLL